MACRLVWSDALVLLFFPTHDIVKQLWHTILAKVFKFLLHIASVHVTHCLSNCYVYKVSFIYQNWRVSYVHIKAIMFEKLKHRFSLIFIVFSFLCSPLDLVISVIFSHIYCFIWLKLSTISVFIFSVIEILMFVTRHYGQRKLL